MSYCVNCGVELESSLKACPLCNTRVVNPKELHGGTESPFPQKKGQVDKIRKKDLAILLSVVLTAAGLTCGILNLLVFQSSPWSLFIIGGCMVLWVFSIPLVIYREISPYLALLLDGAAAGIYLFLLTFVTSGRDWYVKLALPIVVLTVCVLEAFVLCIRRLPATFLTCILYFVSCTAVLCLGLECLIDLFLHQTIQLVWSAVVLTVCVILDITLITLLSRSRLRNAVQRRLHF